MLLLKILAVPYYAYIAWLIVSIATKGIKPRPQNTTIPLEVK